jgi:hypothetical protein
LETAYKVVAAWTQLISGVFVKYPVPAAVCTAAAGLAWILLEAKRNPEKRRPLSAKHALTCLFCWAIAVPIVGFAVDVIGGGAAALGWVLERYERQPLLVLGWLFVCLAGRGAWRMARPRTGKLLSWATMLVVFAVGVALAVPIADRLLQLPKREQSSLPSTSGLAATPTPRLTEESSQRRPNEGAYRP